jgi:hypothetical protein
MTTRTRYRLETSRGGDPWEPERLHLDNPDDFYSVKAVKAFALDWGLVNAKRRARVIAEDGTVAALLVRPYSSPCLDLMEDGAAWLETIRDDYGIPDDLFHAALRRWLEVNPEK